MSACGVHVCYFFYITSDQRPWFRRSACCLHWWGHPARTGRCCEICLVALISSLAADLCPSVRSFTAMFGFWRSNLTMPATFTGESIPSMLSSLRSTRNLAGRSGFLCTLTATVPGICPTRNNGCPRFVRLWQLAVVYVLDICVSGQFPRFFCCFVTLNYTPLPTSLLHPVSCCMCAYFLKPKRWTVCTFNK